MGCASSTEAKAEQSNSAGGGGKQREAKRDQEKEDRADARSKAKLRDPELVALAAPGLVHEQYTFDQGGTLGAPLGPHPQLQGARKRSPAVHRAVSA